jgi:hypothetical protein
MIQRNPRATRRPTWIVQSANSEKYQEDVAKKMEGKEARYTIHGLLEAIYSSPEANIKRTNRRTKPYPKKKNLKWITTEIRLKIRERRKAERM